MPKVGDLALLFDDDFPFPLAAIPIAVTSTAVGALPKPIAVTEILIRPSGRPSGRSPPRLPASPNAFLRGDGVLFLGPPASRRHTQEALRYTEIREPPGRSPELLGGMPADSEIRPPIPT